MRLLANSVLLDKSGRKKSRAQSAGYSWNNPDCPANFISEIPRTPGPQLTLASPIRFLHSHFMFSRSPVSEFACARPKIELFARIARTATRTATLTVLLGSATLGGAVWSARTALAAPVAAQGGLRINFGAKGIDALVYNGVNLAGKNSLKTNVGIRKADGGTEPASDANAVSSFDSATATQTVQYSWGKVAYHYAVKGDNLLVTTTISNQISQPVFATYSRPLMLQVAGGLQSPGPQGSNSNLDDLAIIRREFTSPTGTSGASGGSIFLVSEDSDPTLTLRLGSGTASSYGVEWIPVQKTASDNVHADGPDIAPGQSKSYTFSLRFGPQSRTFDAFSGPLYAEHGQQLGTLLNWSDRRPIGSIFAANSNTGYPTNPRGWFNDSKVDVISAAGRAAFEKRMLSFADGCVKNLKNVGAQGMIFWDLEGEEMPHATTYLGDPRILPQAAPEMDAVADQFFAKFRAAGLKTGVTLRPSRVVIDPKTGKWRHNHMAFDVVNEISEKIDYAQKRWGCTIFYVDSNATYAFLSDGKVTAWTMRAEMFRELARLHPDCLIIPEHASFDYRSATAPYQELRSNHFGTDDLARVAFKDAFSVINIADGDLVRHHDALVQDIKNGDVLLFRCWFDDKTHEPVKQLYQEAGRQETPQPKATPTVDHTPTLDFEHEIIVDNRDRGAFFEDVWKFSGAIKGFYAQDYQHDGNTAKGQKSARFRPDLPHAGTWEVYARWSAGYPNRATNAPYDINAADATNRAPSATVICNQRQGKGEWFSLGQYRFESGTQGNVLLRTDGTNGYVIADAIKWVFVSDEAPQPPAPAPYASPAAAADPTAPSANAS